MLGIVNAGITAAKFVGSMAAWEVGTQALTWAFGENEDTDIPAEETPDQIEYDINGNMIGVVGAAGTMGAVYGGKKMFNQRNKTSIPRRTGSNKRNLTYFDKVLPKTDTAKKSDQSIPKISGTRMYEPRTSIIIDKPKLASHLFNSPKISDSPGSKTLIQKALKFMPKTKKGKLGAAMVLLSAIGAGLKMIGRDKPTNELGDRLLRNALLNKAFESETENALGIDYASKIQRNMGKQLNSLLKAPEVSVEDTGKLIEKSEADLQDAGIDMVINSYQMFKLRGGNNKAFIQSSNEYNVLKKAKNAISAEAAIIRGTGSDEKKNQARQSIMQIKRALIGQDNKEMQDSIRIANNYFRNAIAMRQSLMGTVKKKGSTPIVNASLLREFHTMIVDFYVNKRYINV